MSVSITSTIKNPPKNLPFGEIAKAILGVKYEVSLTFVGHKRARRINQDYRHKDYVPNVLSFPLTDNVGEVFICPQVAKAEAKKFDLTPNGYITYLFIHACLHLKGLDHGQKMDQLETKYKKQFRVK